VDLAGALSLWREAARELATYAEEVGGCRCTMPYYTALMYMLPDVHKQQADSELEL
jgi:hypothetical protein